MKETNYFRNTLKQIFVLAVYLEYSSGIGQLSDVNCSAHVMGRYLANAIVSDNSKRRK